MNTANTESEIALVNAPLAEIEAVELELREEATLCICKTLF
jgi:hypothetical protein